MFQNLRAHSTDMIRDECPFLGNPRNWMKKLVCALVLIRSKWFLDVGIAGCLAVDEKKGH